MFDPGIERICIQIEQIEPISSQDAQDLRQILAYFAKSSLLVLRIEGSDLVIGEQEQYLLSVPQLLALWHGLRDGQAIDWSQLPKAGA